MTIKTYYTLTKPGIVYGNLIATIAGFLLASQGHLHLQLFLGVMIGVSFVIASACVLNNYIDRNVDKQMERTARRAIPAGTVSGKIAVIYAIVLGVIGFTALIIGTNTLTTLLGLVAYFVYVAVYGYAKRHTIYNTLIGGIAGSLPLVAGYTAVTNRIDAGAILLFIILSVWQVPHFFGIAIYRLQDYTNAGLIVWPVKKGVSNTKIQIIIYMLAFIIPAFLLFFFGYAGFLYLAIMAILSVIWIWIGIEGFRAHDDTAWGKKVFLFSLIVLLGFCFAISIPKL